MKLLFIDTETGGLNPETASLLEVGLVVWAQGRIIDAQEIKLKEEQMRVTPEAAAVNKIDLEVHKREALEHEQAIQVMLKFCRKHFPSDELITLAGHNVSFDIAFLKALWSSSDPPFHKLFSHRAIDTVSILKFLWIAGLLPTDISSSDQAFEFFSISVPQRHTALQDAIATARLFDRLLWHCRGNASKSSESVHSSTAFRTRQSSAYGF